jgi:hypothetical protein
MFYYLHVYYIDSLLCIYCIADIVLATSVPFKMDFIIIQIELKMKSSSEIKSLNELF